MGTPLVRALSIAGALSFATAAPSALHAQDTTSSTGRQADDLLAPVIAAGRARDSLSRLADQATGDERTILEEQIWQRHLEVQSGLKAAADELEKLKKQGRDLSAARAVLEDAIRRGWPRYRAQLERRQLAIEALLAARDAATGTPRLAIEAQITEYSERTGKMYHDLIDALLALERLGIDVGRQQAFAIERVRSGTAQTSAHLVVLSREHDLATAQLQRAPNDAAARTELEATDQALSRSVANLETEISLLGRLGEDATPLKVSLILTTGKLTSAAFEPRVIAGLFRHWQGRFLETLATRVPRWFFQGLMIVLIFTGFKLLARLTRKVVRRAVARTGFSRLLRSTITSWSSNLVMIIGVVVILRQLGFQLGPMLAGLGIAGFVLGFAMQDTLSNFAAGGMILAYQPYDVGDDIEAAGVIGKVQKMSLVSTTILTPDNQTLIIPNKKMWGDVIRNVTAQATRRVDLTFGVGYEDDVVKVERVLQEIVDRDERVLKDPPPVIKLHQLADSSVNFVVRLWARKEHYWDVYWGVTRAVKLRFDEEGIKIPFPQRELHVDMIRGRLEGPQ